MDLRDQISFVERVLVFFNIEHRNISIVTLIAMAATMSYIFIIVRGLKNSCKGLNCEKATRAIEKTTSIDTKLHDLENLVIELRSESFSAHSQLKNDLDRFDRCLDDLKQNSTELYGILVGSSGRNTEVNRRRIIHHDD